MYISNILRDQKIFTLLQKIGPDTAENGPNVATNIWQKAGTILSPVGSDRVARRHRAEEARNENIKRRQENETKKETEKTAVDET